MRTVPKSSNIKEKNLTFSGRLTYNSVKCLESGKETHFLPYFFSCVRIVVLKLLSQKWMRRLYLGYDLLPESKFVYFLLFRNVVFHHHRLGQPISLTEADPESAVYSSER